MRLKQLVSLILAAMLVLVVFTGCSSSSSPPEENKDGKSAAETPTTWWGKKWGTPQYGGTLTMRSEMIDVINEPQDPRSSMFGGWLESLFSDSMTVDRSEFPFTLSFVPMKYKEGWLAASWEQTEPTTITVHLRKGIKWQNKPPVNGREFTAEDVQYSYDRLLGTGNGFTKPNPFFSSLMPAVERVVATDKYTVQFKLKQSSAMAIYQVAGPFLHAGFVAKEWVELGENGQKDWHNVVGTGPYMLTDFVPGTSLTMSKNPDYWGKDSRYPDNKLPYLDAVKVLAIPDMSTATAALRTGKVDMIADDRSHLSVQEAQALAKTNPDIQQFWWPSAGGAVTFKYKAKPFDDIKVRKALQLAVDIKGIAKNYYLDSIEGIPVGLSSTLLGPEWSVPYEQWPQALQEEYSYNPEKAKQLLAEAGYPNGFKTNVVAANVDDMQLLQIFKDSFKSIGIDMEIKASDMITQRNIVNGLLYDQMVYNGASNGPTGNTTPPDQTISSFYSKKMERLGGVEDPKYDAIVERFNAAATEGEAQKIYKEASQYILEQHYAAVAAPILNPQVAQPWVKGWAGEHFWSIPTWKYYGSMWIDQSLK